MTTAADSRAAKLLPRNDWISLHWRRPRPFPDRFEGCFQRCNCHTASPVLLVLHKAGNSPEFLCAVFERQGSIMSLVVDPLQLFSRPILAPAHCLPLRVNQDPVCAPLLDQILLLAPIAQASLRTCAPPLVLSQCSWPLKMHAPARILAISL